MATPASIIKRRLLRLVQLKERELAPFLWSFLYFFAIMCTNYILRPLRDEIGIMSGVDNLKWVFTASFVVMLPMVPLFGWLTGRFHRARLLPLIYLFFAANLLLFYLLFRSPLSGVWVGRAFFVWNSVFNLFVISIFWSFMADLFTPEQAGRLFGAIAAGGSVGAVSGPLITSLLATSIGPLNLLPICVALLLLAVVCIKALTKHVADGPSASPSSNAKPRGQGLSGNICAGAVRVFRSPYLMGIVIFIFLYTTLSTILYFEQAHLIRDAFASSGERTRIFSLMDLAVNILTISAQLFITSRIVNRLGLSFALAIIPLLLAAGLMFLGLFPLLPVILGLQIIRRAGNYAITRPAREMLYTVVPIEDKYRSKNFIDTVVYRGGDVSSGWLFSGLKAVGLTLSAIALVAVPISLLWVGVAWSLGKMKDHHPVT
ncbi:MFS transporter [Myxococcota bacterium]|nr:MFS transporter [Myxococcota bacterium]